MSVTDLLLAYLIADFISGVLHFLEDNFWSPHTPIIGSIIEANRMHHLQPRYMLRYTYFETIGSTLYVTTPFLLISWLIFGYIPMLLIYIWAFGSQINQVHKYSHMTEAEQPVHYKVLRHLRLVQTHHHCHHQPPYRSHYCILTDYLNPLLNYTRFWDGLRIILTYCGLPPAPIETM